jgi:hypothetical protein
MGGPGIDWQGKSLPAQVLDGLLVGHLGYTLALVAAMRGWRILAAAAGVLSLGLSFVVNMWAWFGVTGAYL